MSLLKLGEYIDLNQAEPFVKTYLICLAQGYQLSCPITKKEDELTQEWMKILAKYRDNFSDEFCDQVSKYWLSLLSKCDESSGQIELQLFQFAGIAEDEIKESRKHVKAVIKKTEGEIPELRKSQQANVDSLTKPEISESYKQRRLAEDVSLPDLQKLNTVYQKSLKSKDANQFLISHLTFAKYQVEKEVPRSTVPQVIRERWESIILEEFNMIPDDGFLADLTNEWFYLVNQRGIPSKIQDVEELLMTFLTKQQKFKKSPKPKKQQSFLSKLFGS